MENKRITQFSKFGLTPELIRGLEKMNFQTPSEVQQAAITPMLEHKDVLVQAPTGTGKTAAFGIPVVENIEAGNRQIQTVILCPTRELAVQTATVLKQLTAFKEGIRVMALYGGESIQRQIMALKRRPQIIVATPGRLMDHMKRRTTRLDHVGCIVLDEADRMLDMGFRDDIATILQSVPNRQQTVLFSATLSDEIKKIATTYQTEALQICVEQKGLAVDKVSQYYQIVKKNTKTPALFTLLQEKKFGVSLVFVATKAMAGKLAEQLSEEGYSAEAIHGDLRQSQRNLVMKRYRSGEVNILVATDVAARGIDVDGIDAVINYDIPGDSDSYVHRIGRTGRANRNGVAYTFVYPKEYRQLEAIITDTHAEMTLANTEAGVDLDKRDFENKRGSSAKRASNFKKPTGARNSRGSRKPGGSRSTDGAKKPYGSRGASSAKGSGDSRKAGDASSARKSGPARGTKKGGTAHSPRNPKSAKYSSKNKGRRK